MASTPLLARLFATLLPHRLAQIGTNPFLLAPHNIVGSLYTVRVAAKQRWGQLYIRLLFAYSQDLKTNATNAGRAASRARHAGAFSVDCFGGSDPTSKKKYWKEVLW